MNDLKTIRDALETAKDRLEWFADSYPHDYVGTKTEFLAPVTESIALLDKLMEQEPATQNVDAALKLVDTYLIESRSADLTGGELKRLYHTMRNAIRTLAAPQAAQPVKYVLSPVDIYDFAGWLTTRKEVLEIGSSKEAGPMAEAVGEYLRTFPERFEAQQPPAQDYKALYEDLLHCVGRKCHGESMHDTAKRYLIDREKFGIGAAAEGKSNG